MLGRTQFISWVDQFPYISRMLRDYRDHKALNELTWDKVEGYEFSLWGGNWLAAGVYGDHGLHEKDELDIIAKLMTDADILLDVGANSGIFSCLAASLGKQVIAFEPMPATLAILLKNIKANKFTQVVEILPVAVGEGLEILPFFGRGQGASLVPGWGKHRAFDHILVPSISLDQLLADRLKGLRIVIKIDVEGYEIGVLKGATKLLQTRPPLLIENSVSRNHPDGLNPYFEPIFRMLWNLGYTAYIANSERQKVTEDMLISWVKARNMDNGTENFVFMPNYQ